MLVHYFYIHGFHQKRFIKLLYNNTENEMFLLMWYIIEDHSIMLINIRMVVDRSGTKITIQLYMYIVDLKRSYTVIFA